jgi:hypothetical protein
MLNLRARIEDLQEQSYEEFFNALAMQFLGKQNKQRLTIILKGTFTKMHVFDYTRLNNLSALSGF